MQLTRTLYLFLILLWPLATTAEPFSGGGDALVNEAQSWVSQETGYPLTAIDISAPDRRVPVDSCDTALEFRFPFKNNQRTLEAVCDEPSWKRYIRVKIDKTSRVDSSAQHREFLSEQIRAWLVKETNYPAYAIETLLPDLRIPITPCDHALQFRFPFKNDQNTLEVQCNSPIWKRFIQLQFDELDWALTTTKPLSAGHKISVSDLKLSPYRGRSREIYTDPKLLEGLVLRDSLKANTVIESAMIIHEMVIFLSDRSYEAGELINRADLTRIETETPPANSLSAWPSGVITASRYIERGQTLLDSDIEQSEYVVVSATNIIRGQVITQDMLERTLQSKKQMGAQTLSTLDEAIGLEATRTIRAGAPITTSDLKAADLVRKGEKVKLTVTKGALTISVDTIAMEDGKMGEQVELTNAESGKVIRGIVTGRHQAKGISP